MGTNYDEYRAAQLEDGQLYQDFVVDVAYRAGLVIVQYASKAYQFNIGESRTGAEIKHDKNMETTGNLYIEVAEKARPRPGPYAPSGIMREDHWLFIIGNYDMIFVFPRKLLLGLHKVKGSNNGWRYRRVETATSQAFLLPIEDGRKYAALILEPRASGKVAKIVGNLELLAKELHTAWNEDDTQMTMFTE